MSYFIFRNQTIEPFFGDKDVAYSGYGDISIIPDVDRFIWFYQLPLSTFDKHLAEEISTYFDKLQIVLQRMPQNAQLYVFTLEALFHVQYVGDDFSIYSAVNDFNSKVFDLASKDSRIKVVDLGEFVRSYPSEELVNWKYYFISQTVLNPKLTKDFKTWWVRKQEELALNRKKCLVLDLDNTLWGGILGEDGISGIKIGGDYPGNAFSCWQQSLLSLSKYGVILTVCSKNNEADVLEAWENNPFMVLRKQHFSSWRINWNDKATNIKELAEELNIGLDSMVFVDDNPSERELIRQTLPMVEVPEFSGKPYDLMPFFNDLVDSYFRIYTVTEEDKKKTDQYRANTQRRASLATFANMDEYIKSLEICVNVLPVNDFNRSRVAQLTQKTNQFNLTTRRYTEIDIQRMEKLRWFIFGANVSDRFGDDGITCAIFIKPESEYCISINNLILSCRVLGKGIECVFLNTILNWLRDNNIKQVKAEYIKTAKNGQVADFYDRAGFTFIKSENNEEKRLYELNLDNERENKNYYNVIFNK